MSIKWNNLELPDKYKVELIDDGSSVLASVEILDVMYHSKIEYPDNVDPHVFAIKLKALRRSCEISIIHHLSLKVLENRGLEYTTGRSDTISLLLREELEDLGYSVEGGRIEIIEKVLENKEELNNV